MAIERDDFKNGPRVLILSDDVDNMPTLIVAEHAGKHPVSIEAFGSDETRCMSLLLSRSEAYAVGRALLEIAGE